MGKSVGPTNDVINIHTALSRTNVPQPCEGRFQGGTRKPPTCLVFSLLTLKHRNRPPRHHLESGGPSTIAMFRNTARHGLGEGGPLLHPSEFNIPARGVGAAMVSQPR